MRYGRCVPSIVVFALGSNNILLRHFDNQIRLAKVPIIVLPGQVGATRAGIGANDSESQFGGQPLGAGLLGEVFIGTGQT